MVTLSQFAIAGRRVMRGNRPRAIFVLALLATAIVQRQSPADEGSASGGTAQRAVPVIATRDGGEDWPNFLGPRYDNTSTETGIRTDWSDGRLPVVWSRRLGTSYGIGSVAQGRYLQFDRFRDVERLTCLNAETGDELWHNDQPVVYEDMYGYNNGPRSSPTIDGDAVYTMGVGGRLTCRDIRDGAIRWTVDTSAKYGVVQNFFGVGGSPLIIDDYVIVMVGGSPPEDQKIAPGRLERLSPNGSALVAFDKHSGDEAYRVGDYLASYSTPRPMQIDGTTLVLAFVREGLLAIDPVSGEEKWMAPWRSDKLESVNAAVPVVRGDEVMISECYEIGSALLKVTPNSYEILRSDADNRRNQSLRAHWTTPIAVGEFLYGCSGRNPPDSDLRCIDWSTGAVQWSDPRRERTSLLGVDGHFVVLGERGEMELIRATPDAYTPVTRINLAEVGIGPSARPRLTYPCWAAPILSHGLLYVRGDNALICFELIPEDAGRAAQ